VLGVRSGACAPSCAILARSLGRFEGDSAGVALFHLRDRHSREGQQSGNLSSAFGIHSHPHASHFSTQRWTLLMCTDYTERACTRYTLAYLVHTSPTSTQHTHTPTPTAKTSRQTFARRNASFAAWN
jgi:hypothetical protein